MNYLSTMKVLKAERTSYEIEKNIGEGLTGTVYKAFRVDSRRQTRQVVALKILKSRNHVHIFRQEFERLMQISSAHCVKLLGWENLEAGPALVLEFLEGLTLDELIRRETLEKELILEIALQAQQGLKDLHHAGIIHGDLNCKNIFITKKGVVKLLDFGWSTKTTEILATPQFMSPELWQGSQRTAKSDLFSLGLIYLDLLEGKINEQGSQTHWRERCRRAYNNNALLAENPSQRQWLKGQVRPYKQRKISKRVHRNLKNDPIKTQLLSHRPSRRSSFLKKALLVAGFLYMSFYPKLEAGDFAGHQLIVRSDQWLEVSLNGLPGEFAPTHWKDLRPGQYQLRWRTTSGQGVKTLVIRKDLLFSLQLEDILLR